MLCRRIFVVFVFVFVFVFVIDILLLSAGNIIRRDGII